MSHLLSQFIWVSSLLFVSAGCISIPKAAPELSEELGIRISKLETAHMTLLTKFFDEKRDKVDDFVENVWTPIFAEELFKDPNISKVWTQVVASGNDADRLKFLVMVGPKLQAKINSQRLDLIKPLDNLERDIKNRVKQDYDQARSINNSITSLLYSASKIDESRSKYLAMLGVTDARIDNALDQVESLTDDLVKGAESVERNVAKAAEYQNKLKEIKVDLTK